MKKLLDLIRLNRARKQGRLVRHYFLASVILISGGLFTSGLLEVYFVYQESWEHLGRVQKEIASATAFKIEQYVEEIERTMRSATKTREIVRDGLSPDYKWELRRLLVNSPSIAEAVAFDATGAKHAEAWRVRPVRRQNKWRSSSQAALEKAKEGKSYFGPVYFAEGTGPYMTIAVPIARFAGEFIGILLAEVDLKYVGQVLSSARVGKAGQAYLVTSSGDLIAHPDLSLVLQKRNLARLEQVEAAFSGAARPNVLVTQNMQGEKVFTSFALIPSLSWAVLAEQPIEEVYAPLYASMLRTSGLLLIGFAVALLATLLVRRRVVRPLESLRQGVERIREGDLSARLDVKTGDEIEILADEFNDMAAHLREAYTGLERKVAERTQALTIANEKLEKASKHKSQFLANVNHELRTPVSAIIGYARLVLRATEGQIAPLQRENLQDLLQNAERLLHLIDSLLDFAKIEAGRMDVRVEPVRIDALIDGATSTIEPLLNDGNVRLIREIAPGIPALSTDREKLKQIVLNLLDNAVKFTERGQIRIVATQQNGSLKLVVADTGIGIREEDLKQIFEEFHRGDLPGIKQYRGTGLGLAIVKRFVTLLGGDIAVESELGKGSSFTVVLPLDVKQSMSE
ncbi:MAG: HAMP domain-containing protein [Deltaproteobacteria bacterium]|nr:HAMP domain-containing protein [Deltaproteobacteria bacterium]